MRSSRGACKISAKLKTTCCSMVTAICCCLVLLLGQYLNLLKCQHVINYAGSTNEKVEYSAVSSIWHLRVFVLYNR